MNIADNDHSTLCDCDHFQFQHHADLPRKCRFPSCGCVSFRPAARQSGYFPYEPVTCPQCEKEFTGLWHHNMDSQVCPGNHEFEAPFPGYGPRKPGIDAQAANLGRSGVIYRPDSGRRAGA